MVLLTPGPGGTKQKAKADLYRTGSLPCHIYIYPLENKFTGCGNAVSRKEVKRNTVAPGKGKVPVAVKRYVFWWRARDMQGKRAARRDDAMALASVRGFVDSWMLPTRRQGQHNKFYAG